MVMGSSFFFRPAPFSLDLDFGLISRPGGLSELNLNESNLLPSESMGESMFGTSTSGASAAKGHSFVGLGRFGKMTNGDREGADDGESAASASASASAPEEEGRRTVDQLGRRGAVGLEAAD